MEYKIDIGGVVYSMSELYSVKVHQPLFGTFSAGNACAAKIEVEFLPGEEPPLMANIVPYCRETEDDEWQKVGEFFTDERKDDRGRKTIIGYDAMLKADVEFLGTSSDGVWPRQMSSVVAEIAECMGVEVDDRTELNPAYMLAYPLKYTMRELLKHIAVAHGGNWIVTGEGKLRLVPLFPHAEVVNHDIGMKATKFEKRNAFAPISGIDVKADETYSYFAGDDTGYVMNMFCPSITQEMVDALLIAAKGAVYQGFSATGVYLPPTAELGETVTVDGFTGIIADRVLKFGHGHLSDVSAPGGNEVIHEYNAPSAAQREMERKLAQTKAEIKVDTDRIQMTVDDLEGNLSKIDQKVDGISLSVSGTLSDGTNSYVEITLQVGEHTSKGYVMIDGNVNVSGQLSAEALYAALGDIAKLTVDSVSTSRRIPLYLAGDTSDDNYIDISEQHIRLMRGQTDGTSEQARNPYGSLLYWENDVDAASIGIDGYPYLNGQRIFTTTEKTNWPVMVYVYTDAIRREISFNTDEARTPIDVFGHGYGMNDPDRGKGFIQKFTDTFDMWLLNSKGERRGIFIGDDYTDLAGMRKTTNLDFSSWDSGRFYETVDGDTTRHVYNVEFDASKRPTKITDADGHVMTITW